MTTVDRLRAIPESTPASQRRILPRTNPSPRQAKFRQCHERKLAEINSRAPGTGTLDNTRPYTAGLVHLKTRPRKKAILAARDAEVERRNR